MHVALLILSRLCLTKETPIKHIYKVMKGWIHLEELLVNLTCALTPGSCQAFNPESRQAWLLQILQRRTEAGSNGAISFSIKGREEEKHFIESLAQQNFKVRGGSGGSS